MKKKYLYDKTARDRRSEQNKMRAENIAVDQGVRAKNREFMKKLLLFILIGVLAVSAGTIGIILLAQGNYIGIYPVAEIKLEMQGKKYTLVYQLFNGENEQALAAGLFMQSAQSKIYNETVVSQVTKDMLTGGKYTEYTEDNKISRFLEPAYVGKVYEITKNSDVYDGNLSTFGYLSLAKKDSWSGYYTPEFQICVRGAHPVGSVSGITIGYAYDNDTIRQLEELVAAVTVDSTNYIPDNVITVVSVKIFNIGKEYRNYNIKDHFEESNYREYS